VEALLPRSFNVHLSHGEKAAQHQFVPVAGPGPHYGACKWPARRRCFNAVQGRQ
jgi:hypothetical protein